MNTCFNCGKDDNNHISGWYYPLCKECDEKLTDGEEKDLAWLYDNCEAQPEIYCPYCGKEISEWGYYLRQIDNNNEVQIECEHCEKLFKCKVTHSITFTSTRIFK